MTGPGLSSIAYCKEVEGRGFRCMLEACEHLATGHLSVVGGPHDGRLLALLCAVHAEAHAEYEVRRQLGAWMVAGLLDPQLGPGQLGAPGVDHGGHIDALPDRCLS